MNIHLSQPEVNLKLLQERPQTTMTLTNLGKKIQIRPSSNIVMKKPASAVKFAMNKSVDEKIGRPQSPNAVTTTLK